MSARKPERDGARGVVTAVLRSSGGVPKRPVEGAVFVGTEGLEGDWQTDRKHHGGPDRAVCLFSSDLIESLRGEGHPIAPGSLGENLCLAGLDWSRVSAGARLRVGEQLLLEVTRDAPPCRTIAHCFIEGAFDRVSEKRHPGWSRAYARVLVEGEVAAGDPVVLVLG